MRTLANRLDAWTCLNKSLYHFGCPLFQIVNGQHQITTATTTATIICHLAVDYWPNQNIFIVNISDVLLFSQYYSFSFMINFNLEKKLRIIKDLLILVSILISIGLFEAKIIQSNRLGHTMENGKSNGISSFRFARWENFFLLISAQIKVEDGGGGSGGCSVRFDCRRLWCLSTMNFFPNFIYSIIDHFSFTLFLFNKSFSFAKISWDLKKEMRLSQWSNTNIFSIFIILIVQCENLFSIIIIIDKI